MSMARAATQPWVESPCHPPELGIRSCEGLKPTRPQQAAGIRIEPAPSEAVAMPTAPAATRAADPPDDPPGVCEVLRGLRVTPNRSDSVNPKMASSGEV